MASWLLQVKTTEPGVVLEARIEARNRAAAIRKLLRRKVFADGHDEPVSMMVTPYVDSPPGRRRGTRGAEGKRLRLLARLLYLGGESDGIEVTLIVEDPRCPGMALGRRGRVWISSGTKVSLIGGESKWIDLRDVERVEIAGGLRTTRQVEDAHRAAWREGQERAERSDAEKEERSHFG